MLARSDIERQAFKPSAKTGEIQAVVS